MSPRVADRPVTALPLAELWGEHGPLPLARVRELDAGEARALLAWRGTALVIAAEGEPPRWIAPDDVGAAWTARRETDRASEWRTDCGPSVVLLERAEGQA